jgi:probable phosphoglycerate mutase
MNYPPLYILRHGQTVWNAERRIQGSLDSDLTQTGISQAEAQRRILERRDLAGFSALSSPQGRALRTADLALSGLVARIETDQRLREIGVGAWEGLRRIEIAPDAPADESEESALELYEKAPRGEGLHALRDRCTSFLSDVQGPSILVTHGITSRMLRLILLGMSTGEIGDLPGGQGVVFFVENGVQIKLSIGA